MKACAILIFTLLTVAAHSQSNYKYVLVPPKFDFLKFDDQYQLNSTTKSLLQEKGFTVFWANGDMPPDLAANKCSALIAEVIQRKSFFTTVLTVQLKDCSGNIVFKSKEGKSHEKEFGPSFDEALRNAFTSLTAVPNVSPATASTSPAPAPPASVPAQAPANSPPTPAKPAVTTATEATLYAQPTPNGYQLVDTTPKKVLTILKTSMQDYFIADGGSFSGILFKKDGEWLLEYYKDDKLVSQKLSIKF